MNAHTVMYEYYITEAEQAMFSFLLEKMKSTEVQILGELRMRGTTN